MPFSDHTINTVPFKLLKDGVVVAETVGEPDLFYNDVIDHYALALQFVDYIVSIRKQLLSTPNRKRKETVREDWQLLIIQYKDQTVTYHKDELIVPTPIALSA
jgi:hypothetical protein